MGEANGVCERMRWREREMMVHLERVLFEIVQFQPSHPLGLVRRVQSHNYVVVVVAGVGKKTESR